MAHAAQTPANLRDLRFHYEPLLSPHPTTPVATQFAGFKFSFPLWISSMTGGAAHARALNSTMARACAEFDLGMGLGSCRPLLEDENTLPDFNVRSLMPGRPLYANLGIAQIEQLAKSKELDRVHRMVEKLKADGLIIHVNPLQEWFQPEGDRLSVSPLETITRFVELAPYGVMVKEVGHGMGPASLKALMRLPLVAIEFGAFGGTNFSLLELRRSTHDSRPPGLAYVGHSAQEMVGFVTALQLSGEKFKCQNFIVSGGVSDSLQGHHLCGQLLRGEVLFGMAHGVLAAARLGSEALSQFITAQRDQYLLALNYLRPLSQENP
jgi:isopentenyl-diphosphate delta-isomerase